MKIGFLIIAHHQPSFLAELVDSLQSPESFFFIHVDKKVEISPFIIHSQNVVFLPTESRVSVNWGGYSQVRATLNLVNFAIKQQPSLDRFCLLSGSDFPIKPLAEIKATFQSDREFIQIQRKLLVNGLSWIDKRASWLCLNDTFFLQAKFIPEIVKKIVLKLSRFYQRKFPIQIELYYGSNWWCLSRGAICGILAEVKKRPDVQKWFKRTVCSDELFFQSFIKLTEFSAKITYDYSGFPVDQFKEYESMHYIDWFTPNPTVPKVLGLEDAAKLSSSSGLFARKFDMVRSRPLIDLIKERCRRETLE